MWLGLTGSLFLESHKKTKIDANVSHPCSYCQKRFEKNLQRIWMRAGLKKAPEGWNTPKIFNKQYKSWRD